MSRKDFLCWCTPWKKRHEFVWKVKSSTKSVPLHDSNTCLVTCKRLISLVILFWSFNLSMLQGETLKWMMVDITDWVKLSQPVSYLAFDDERFFLVTPCLRPLTETSWKKGSLIQIIAENIQGKIVMHWTCSTPTA